jgi:hypothetical protein
MKVRAASPELGFDFEGCPNYKHGAPTELSGLSGSVGSFSSPMYQNLNAGILVAFAEDISVPGIAASEIPPRLANSWHRSS